MSTTKLPPPAHGMKHIHKGIKHELSAAEAKAQELATGKSNDINAVKKMIEWVEKVIHVHAGGEEDIFYPALDKYEAGVSKSYSLDHRVEEGIFAEIHELIQECSAGGGAAVRQKLWRQIVAANAIIHLHIKKEEELLLPLFDQHIPAADQGALVSKMMGHVPPQEMEGLFKWMVPILTREEREIQVHQILPGLPSHMLPVVKGWYHNSLSAQDWDDLVGRVPALA